MNSSRHLRHTDATHAILIIDQCRHVQQKTDSQLSEMIKKTHKHDLTFSTIESIFTISASKTHKY